ncbi:MAG: ribokinase, partial [Acidiphilium sp. 21-68-69]
AERFEVVPREVVMPVDSTGAGDAFNGTFLACRMQGMTPASAVAAAQAVAARAVLTRGALIADEG